MSSVIWRTPPPSEIGTPHAKARTKELNALAQELRDNPGQWALVDSGRPTPGNSEPFRRRGLEVTTRKNKRGMYDIYARHPIA